MGDKTFRYPSDEAEFLKLIEYVDNELKNQNIPIHARPIRAVGEICKLLHISLRLTFDRPAVPEVFDSDSFSAHISEWYQKRYGDRLLIDFSPGSVIALVKGDPWKIKFPMIYGTIKLTFDPELDKYPESQDSTTSGSFKANPLRTVLGLTPEVARSLSREEMIGLSKFYVGSFETIQRLFEIKDEPFVSESRSDLANAVENIIRTQPSFGQSKWSSLQFVEKLFKSYLKINNIPFPNTHGLNKLSDIAIGQGFPSFNKTLLSAIQCDPGVRYGEIPVTLPEAIMAHHATLKMSSLIVHMIKGDIPQLKKYQDAKKSPNIIAPGLFYISSLPGRLYYCNKIEDDLVDWYLVEAYRNGSLMQVAFTAYLRDCPDYKLLDDPFEIVRLKRMLDSFKACLLKDQKH